MSELNNIVIAYDAGEEYICEILEDNIHFCGNNYMLLWCQEDEDILVAIKNGEEYKVVHDETVFDRIRTIVFDQEQSLLNEIEEGQDSNDESSFIKDLYDILEGKEVNRKEIIEQLEDITINSFDSEKYIQQSQDYLFTEANKAYIDENYSRALDQFKLADIQGNIYAAAHVGIMYNYGYGCNIDFEKAFEYFKKGAENGCPLATGWLAESYRLGNGVSENKEYAEYLYSKIILDLRKMCEYGDMEALYFLGFNLISGIGEKRDEKEGIRLLKESYKKGEKRAAVKLAHCYYLGKGVEKNPVKTVNLLLKNPIPSHKIAQFLLGKCYYFGEGVEKDLKKAFFHFKMAASLGHGIAKDYLADCYYNGEGTLIDYVEAAKWYKEAADHNRIGRSAYNLAFMYKDGEGVEKNEDKAMKYLIIAAEENFVQAQRIVSQEYIVGRYVKQDYELARMWMEKAAKQGDAQAQVILGQYYISGFGFDNDKKSFEWFMKAAEQGYAEAERIIGGCYLNNLYVDTDLKKANYWYTKAVKHGDAKAEYELGVSYLDGRGVDKNSEKGMNLLVMAANDGVHEAYKELADRFYVGINNFKGEKVYTNFIEAKKYAMLAVQDETDGEAQFRLGSIFQNCFENISSAIEWYMRAVDNENDDAKLELGKIYINQKENCKKAFRLLNGITKNRCSDTKFYEAQYWISVCLKNGYGCEKDKKLAKQYYKKAIDNGYVDKETPRKKKFGIFSF